MAIELLHRQAHVLAAELCEYDTHFSNPDAMAKLETFYGLRDALLEQLKALVQEIRQ